MAKALALLLQQNTVDKHEEILRACTNLLKESKSDLYGQHVRFIALLKLDRYDDALQAFDEAGEGLKQKARLEWAYALYKSGSLKEAIDVAKSVKDDRGARHVEAQASYRSEDFAGAAALYKELAEDGAGAGGEESDLAVNRGATEAQAIWSGQSQQGPTKRYTREDLEAFETAYNAGCVALARGALREAEFLLKTAEGLCASSDELSEQEKAAEILPIKVQQIYLFYQLGKLKEAEDIADEIATRQASDASTQQIAQHNIQAAQSSIVNPFLAQRKLDNERIQTKSDHLFQFQSDGMERNVLTLDLLAFKSAAVIHSTERVIAKDGPTTSSRTNSLSTLNAAAHAQSRLAKLGLKHIQPLFSKRPADIGLALTIIQLYMLTSNPGAAAGVLETLLKNLSAASEKDSRRESVLYAPGLVALQVSLYGRQNRTSQVKSVLAKASSYWRHKSKTTLTSRQPRPTPLLHATGLSLLESTLPAHQTEARNIFQTLYDESPTPFARAGYVAALALTSPETVAAEADSLTSIANLTKDIDISALEAAGVPNPSPPDSVTGKGDGQSRKRPAIASLAPGESGKDKPRKRFRKARMPKSYDPARKVDPERWLPMRDRSYYRPPKGKRGKKKGGAGDDKTQGGAVVEDAAAGAGAGSQKADAGGGGGGVIVGSGSGGGGGGKAKGKKKGKR